MSIFNNRSIEAIYTGEYRCDKCGGLMKFELDGLDILICPNCGNSTDLDHYGLTDEEYDKIYPSFDELSLDDGESYEDVYGDVK